MFNHRIISFTAAAAVAAGTLATAAVAAAGPANAAKKDVFAAIAYSESEGYAGWTTNATSKADAQDAALEQCETESGSSCEVAAWVKNGCVAIALTEDGKWSGGYGSDSAAAEAGALEDLPSGEVKKVVCTPNVES
jgi:hypothetical protein